METPFGPRLPWRENPPRKPPTRSPPRAAPPDPKPPAPLALPLGMAQVPCPFCNHPLLVRNTPPSEQYQCPSCKLWCRYPPGEEPPEPSAGDYLGSLSASEPKLERRYRPSPPLVRERRDSRFSPIPAGNTDRPQNGCETCGHTWFPRGSDLSAKCPRCGSQNVTIIPTYQPFGCVVLIAMSLVIATAAQVVVAFGTN